MNSVENWPYNSCSRTTIEVQTLHLAESVQYGVYGLLSLCVEQQDWVGVGFFAVSPNALDAADVVGTQVKIAVLTRSIVLEFQIGEEVERLKR